MTYVEEPVDKNCLCGTWREKTSKDDFCNFDGSNCEDDSEFSHIRKTEQVQRDESINSAHMISLNI